MHLGAVRFCLLAWLCVACFSPHASAQITGRPNTAIPYYPTAVGAPPPAGTFAFREWLDQLLAHRLAECPSQRARTIHIAWGDATSNAYREGTAEEPLKARTPGEIQHIIEQTIGEGDVAFLLRRGDVFRVTPDDLRTIKVRSPNVTIGAYGSVGNKPMLTGFVPIEQLVAPKDATYEVWTRPDPNQWPDVWAITIREGVIIRHVHDYVNDTLADVYVRCNEPSEVQDAFVIEADHDSGTLIEIAVERSFWFNDATSTLYVRTPAGQVPPSDTLEGAIAPADPQSEASGVQLGAGSDGSRLENLRVDGFGVGHGPERNTQIYCIKLSHGIGERAVVIDCEAYFSSSHVIGDLNDRSISTYVRCIAGHARNTFGNSNGHPTIFNSYSLWGGQETIFDNCVVPFGALPEHGLRARIGRGFYLHTRGATHPPRLLIIRGCRVENNRFGCFDPWGFRDLPRPTVDAAQLDAYRVYVVDSVFHGGNGVGTGPLDRAIFLNTKYENMNVVVGPGNEYGFWLFQNVTQPLCAVFINCSWSFATPFTVPGAAGHIGMIRSNYSGSQGPHLLDFVNCRIDVHGASNRPLRFHDPIERNGIFLGTRTRLINSIITHRDGGTSPPHAALNQQPVFGAGVFPQGGIKHTAFGFAGVVQPATSGLLQGYDQAPGIVTITSGTDIGGVPSGLTPNRPAPGSMLYKTGTGNFPFPVEFDQTWKPIGPTPSIGPLQHTNCIADFDESGEVTVEDYFSFIAAFFDGIDTPYATSPADLDGDGVVTVADFFLFIGIFVSAMSGQPC